MNLNGGSPPVGPLRVYPALLPLPGPGPINPLMTENFMKSFWYYIGIFDELFGKFWLADWVS